MKTHLTDADRASMAKTTTLYRLLGLLGPDQDYLDVYESYVAQALVGVYSPRDKALWVVHPDGQSTNFSKLGGDEKQTLEHELVHAVQDAHFDLSAMAATGGDLDLGLTATAVIEGDAVSTQRDFDAKYAAVALGGAVILADMNRLQATAPASIQRELLFPYSEGADWIARIRQQGGNDAVDRLFKDVPKGTVFVFHPERLGTDWKPTQVALPGLADAMGDGWAHESGGVLGQFELQNYLQLRLPGLQAVQGADGWEGDHYDVYHHGDESVAVVRVAFSSAAEATQFASAQDDLLKAGGAKHSQSGGLELDTLSQGRTIVRLPSDGATLTFVAGSNPGVAERAARALANG
jgi:hypothetical protein